MRKTKHSYDGSTAFKSSVFVESQTKFPQLLEMTGPDCRVATDDKFLKKV